ncbi:MAG: conserved membrane protein of unknown function [Nitrospira sp.]|nr:hypothetical protein [Nitrospira sp.]ULA60753.1 MAG: conserved membrane protein of unknown function [Nitrospira sp.]
MAFKGDDSTLSLATTVTLALAVAAMVFVKEPLKSSRPTGSGTDRNRATSELKVHARLWEDPFAAVQKDLEARKRDGLVVMGKGDMSFSYAGHSTATSLTGEVRIQSRKNEDESNGLDVLKNKIRQSAERGEQVTALIMMTRGGAYVDDSEWRIRDRYAVEAALEVGCFKAAQTQYLSYFIANFESGPNHHFFAVPYEWYRHSKIAACRRSSDAEGETKDQQVLLLWVAADEFGPSILQRIDELLTKIQKHSPVTAKIIGPRSSSEFRSILKEIEEKGQAQQERAGAKSTSFTWKNNGGHIEIYSPWATAMPGLLSYRLKSPTQNGGVECQSYQTCSRMFDRLLSDAGLDLRYHIDNDRALFESLFHELNRRQVTVGEDSIVLIGEWDSFYARALPLTFSAVACKYIADSNIQKAHPPSDALMKQLGGKCATTEDGIDQIKTGAVSPQALQIRQYSYLSGLDGEVLEERPSKLMPKKEEKEKDDGAKEKLRDIASYEKPEGSSQLDYIRRLVARIKSEEQGKKVKAIGILGSDMYDALLILQAVREQFPTVQFFTTDLDARYFDESERKWARNVLVVSHFGLQLAPELQQSIPPFRTSYQTSAFFAVLTAIGHIAFPASRGMDEKKKPSYTLQLGNEKQIEYSLAILPRLFEIGRRGAVDISVDAFDEGLSNIHPARSDVDIRTGRVSIPPRIESLWIVGVVLGFLALWGYGRYWNWLTARDEQDSRLQTFQRTLRPAWVPLVVIGGVLLWCQIRHFNYAEDEPFSWFDGVSIWPTEVLRLFATLLSIFFLFKAWADLAANTTDLSAKFFAPGQSIGREAGWRGSLKKFWGDLDWMFHGSKRDHPGEAVTLWIRYCRAHTCPQRAARVVLWLVLYLVMILPVWRFMNDGEWRLYVPCRGTFSCRADAILTSLSVFSLIILNLAVLDAVILCTKWIQEMPLTTGLNPIRQVRLIIERTRIVNRRILYPFLSLFLLIAARSHYFDNWDFPPVLILVLTVNSLVAITSASLLYLAAVQAKRRILASIQEQLDRAMDQIEGTGLTPIQAASGHSIERLRQIITDIDGIQQGAFVPFYQQPMVQATLVAALAFLQYWYLGQ